ncbi:MAG: UvrB/UvrC motif-containing protein [Actinomycetota bacterium]|nr:UvrB/UvrC motif-containing protein [Actinomycetota bacterium]
MEDVRGEKGAAVRTQEYERAAELRDQEKQLLAQKAARQQEWITVHPSLPDLAESCQQLSTEVKELRALLHQHGIDPQDPTA